MFHFSGAVHIDQESVPSYRPKVVSSSHREYPICNCVHSYSISPLSDVIFKKKNMSFAMITKPCAHRGPVPTFAPCTRASKPYPNSSVGMLHISAQRVPYFGTKCERCIYFTFPRATEKIGHVYRHAGYLFH